MNIDEFSSVQPVQAPPAPPHAEQKVLYEGTKATGLFRTTQVCITTRAIEIDVSGADPTMSILTLGCWYMFFQFDYIERYPLSRVESLEMLHGDSGITLRGVVRGRRRGCCPLCPCQALRAESCCSRARAFELRIAHVGSDEDVDAMFEELEAARKACRARSKGEGHGGGRGRRGHGRDQGRDKGRDKGLGAGRQHSREMHQWSDGAAEGGRGGSGGGDGGGEDTDDDGVPLMDSDGDSDSDGESSCDFGEGYSDDG